MPQGWQLDLSFLKNEARHLCHIRGPGRALSLTWPNHLRINLPGLRGVGTNAIFSRSYANLDRQRGRACSLVTSPLFSSSGYVFMVM